MTTYKQEDFDHPNKACDLVMKGGITSGVVYPRAILELAKEHRFVNLGGTSAGAIAAGLAAAAEYGRDGGGFLQLGELPDYLQEHLLDLFQPDPRHKKTFRAALKLLKEKKNPLRSVWSAVRFIPTARRLLKTYRALPETYFGLCPGPTQKGNKTPGLTDWLNERIESMAGRLGADGSLPSTPLTMGDLAAKGIRLKTITTDLGSRNPVLLPFADATWILNKDEMAKLLPANVLQWLTPDDAAVEGFPGFYRLPAGDRLPVLVAVRASLSFPVLLAALPLYREDYSLRLNKAAQKTPRRCWLSDGGITSNFPIHLFDNALPGRPTFGISLETFDTDRNHADETYAPGRVYLPDAAGEGIRRPIYDIDSPVGFLGAIFTSAKDWQDTLQSVLPGYRERIVHIALTGQEGGLNLEMSQQQVAKLAEYGELAGQALSDFDMDEHRWRRLLAAHAALEEALCAVHRGYAGFRTAVQASSPKSYRAESGEAQLLWARWDALIAGTMAWAAGPIRDSWGSSGMPRPRTHLKMVPTEQGGAED